MKLLMPLIALAVCAAQAQMLKIPPSFDKLSDKAEEVADVTLGPDMLGMASKFLSDKDPDEKAAKQLVGGLKGIFVRSYKFANEGEYSDADVELLRAQLRAPGWSCVVNVRNKKERENVQVCFYADNGKSAGMAVVATKPKELTIVTIAGPIDPEHLGALEGQFGIPKVDLDSKPKKQEKKDD
jgi:hypothetical protein